MPSLLRLPLLILLSGLAALVVLVGLRQAGLPGLPAPGTLAALLVFATGLGFAGFLWWLASGCLALLRDPRTTPEQVAALRDLPLGLPEGTVRALLALIVGVIGLPLLLFSQALALDAAIAGYVNGIIAGVFGYYFGTRGEAPAARRLGQALDENAALRARETRIGEETRAEAARDAGAAEDRDRLARHLAVAELVVERLAPALPAGLIPAGAADALAAARGALQGGTPSAVGAALAALTGSGGPFAALLRAAAPLLPAAGGPFAGVALLLGAGWSLGAAAWRRYRAALLDAPHDPTLFDPGAITPASAELRLAASPILARVFAPRLAEPGFVAALLDAALREDAVPRLWAMGGFASPAEAEEGLGQFRRALLAESLGDAAPLPAAEGAPEARGALQALTLLLGEMRERRLDPAPLLREVTP